MYRSSEKIGMSLKKLQGGSEDSIWIQNDGQSFNKWAGSRTFRNREDASESKAGVKSVFTEPRTRQ